MKKLILVVAALLWGFVFQTATAQLRLTLTSNIAAQPVWGPVGYDHVDYYYMPDIDSYYYVPKRQYIYLQDGNWVTATSLPPRFSSYDIYSGYKVVINDPKPYRNADTYRIKYAGYKGKRDQAIIRNSQDSKYFEVKGHPDHDKWAKGRNAKSDKKHHNK